MSAIKGFITNLGKYNEGELVGEWIDFPITEDELEEVLKRIGINEEYEEFFFTDWDCEIDAGLGEYVSVEEVSNLAEELERQDIEVVKAIIEATGYSLEQALSMTDRYAFYEGQTLEDVAYTLINECYDLPEIALRYFDYEAFARDLRFDGYYEVSNGVILID